MGLKHEVEPGVFSPGDVSEMLACAAGLTYGRAPRWLGSFGFLMFGGRSTTKKLPEPMRRFATMMAGLVPAQRFNVAFIQRYTTGQRVHRHYDPKNNTGWTLIAPFGDFTGAASAVERERFRVPVGDVLRLPCTIEGVRGPLHGMDPVESGTRYALILNTIEPHACDRVAPTCCSVSSSRSASAPA